MLTRGKALCLVESVPRMHHLSRPAPRVHALSVGHQAQRRPLICGNKDGFAWQRHSVRTDGVALMSTRGPTRTTIAPNTRTRGRMRPRASCASSTSTTADTSNQAQPQATGFGRQAPRPGSYRLAVLQGRSLLSGRAPPASAWTTVMGLTCLGSAHDLCQSAAAGRSAQGVLFQTSMYAHRVFEGRRGRKTTGAFKRTTDSQAALGGHTTHTHTHTHHVP